MNTEEPRDILITNITMEYGDASHTRDMLKLKYSGYLKNVGTVVNMAKWKISASLLMVLSRSITTHISP
jgi:hypothetical protein